MRGRAVRWVPALLLACLSGCGEAPVPVDWPVVAAFSIDPARARAQGRLSQDDDVVVVMMSVLRVVDSRLQESTFGAHGVVPGTANRFAIGLSTLDPAREAELVDLVTRKGSLEFRVLVLPDAEYAARVAPGEPPPARTGVWPGSAEEFARFREEEVARLRRAEVAGTPYVPSRPGLRLARDAVMDGTAPEHFHVLETPPDERAFDGAMVLDPVVVPGATGDPVVVFEIHPDWQEAFEDWTRANVQLPLAIVLDDEVHSVPILRAPLRENVQITPGRGPRARQEAETRALAAVLRAGSLPLRPTFLGITRR